ncbi:unnamed protein product [Angiostrongylus costaricensis]|uniref:KRAP_IP3R_bind domain-containing protein n=1 Tax=Angiostrongylus costaricensis TaxID=334426 RepID=A0A0R3PTA5_ANGCS|nr:unnamed protein product [Angiostrongylus costaricensis]
MQPTWRDRKTMRANGTTNSLLKQAIVNRLKPSLTSENNQAPIKHSLTANLSSVLMKGNEREDVTISTVKEMDKLENMEGKKSGMIPASLKNEDQENFCARKMTQSSKIEEKERNCSAQSSSGYISDEIKATVSCGEEICYHEPSPREEVSHLLLSSNDYEKYLKLCRVNDHAAVEASQSMCEALDAKTKALSFNSKRKAKIGTKENSTVIELTKYSGHKEPISAQPNTEEMQSPANSPPRPVEEQPSLQSSKQITFTVPEVPIALALSNDDETQVSLGNKTMRSGRNRHDSTLNESLRSSFGSQKSVTFNDKVEMHEIERNRTSSSEEDITLMREGEASKSSFETHHHRMHLLQSPENEVQHEYLYDIDKEDDNISRIASALEQPLHSYLAQELEKSDDEESVEAHSPSFSLFLTKEQPRGELSAELQPLFDRVENDIGSVLLRKRTAASHSIGVQTTEFFNPISQQAVVRTPNKNENDSFDTFPRSASGYFEESSYQKGVQNSSLYIPKNTNTFTDAVSFVTTRKSRVNDAIQTSNYGDFLIDIAKRSGQLSRSQSFEKLLPQHIQTRATFLTSLPETARRDEIENQMKSEFLARFGAGRRAPVAEDDPCDPIHTVASLDSVFSTDSQESVVSEVSIRKESATHRHFNY